MSSADYNEMFIEARAAVEQLNPGDIFEVKSLFTGTTWNGLQRGDKTGFGMFFSKKYQSGSLPTIEKIERGKDNHTRYRKL